MRYNRARNEYWISRREQEWLGEPVGNAYGGPAFGEKSDVGSAVSAGASLLGGAMSSDASSDAAAIQANAAGQATALTKEQWHAMRRDLATYRQSGEAANKLLSTYLGLTTGDSEAGQYGSLLKNFTGQDLQNEPGYQFGLSEGEKALNRKSAAAGGYFSGAALKAAQRYGQDYAGTKYNEAYNRDSADKNRIYSMLSGASSSGQNASTLTGQAGLSAANSMGNSIMSGANALAAGQVGSSNAWSSALTGAANALNWNKILGGAGSGGVYSYGNNWFD